jgi:predicted O-methyltransferase YrrM
VIKQLYVGAARGARSGLARVGALEPWDRWASRSRAGHWSRSLLAVYDLEDLMRLDVPWWTYESSGKVARFLASRSEPRVLEWGSGSSTLWLARRAASVTSIEHDEAWAAELAPHLPPHVTLLAVPPQPAAGRTDVVRSRKSGFEGLDFTDYVAAVDRVEGEFDLVVVDGRAREACLPRAVERLAPGGVVVFDNVDRARYRDAIAALGDAVEVDWTRGLTPTLPYPTRTALVRRSTDPRP